jgi:hypothetical protein
MWGADSSSVERDAGEYLKVTQERAGKIVRALGITDTNRAGRVTEIIAFQYRELSRIHDARDVKIEAVKSQGDKPDQQAEVQILKEQAKAQTDQLHKSFLTKLAAELPPEQVDRVKDGMTYNVAPNTYRVYLQMYPTMTDAQKKQVLDWLREAREIAMDAGDSKEKHGVFGKCKGRINNYLVKQGFDLKQGGENLKKASSPVSVTE